jgi:hypothetical protein
VGGIWTLCGLWKGLANGFPSFLYGEFLKKWRELLYEETKTNIKRCVKVVELIVIFFTFSFSVLLSH